MQRAIQDSVTHFLSSGRAAVPAIDWCHSERLGDKSLPPAEALSAAEGEESRI